MKILLFSVVDDEKNNFLCSILIARLKKKKKNVIWQWAGSSSWQGQLAWFTLRQKDNAFYNKSWDKKFIKIKRKKIQFTNHVISKPRYLQISNMKFKKKINKIT